METCSSCGKLFPMCELLAIGYWPFCFHCCKVAYPDLYESSISQCISKARIQVELAEGYL